MKNNSKNAYFKYAKRILEASSISAAANENPEKTKSELVKYIKVAGTGAIGAVACCSFLAKTFSIYTWQTAGYELQNGINQAAAAPVGTFGAIVQPIWTSIKNAVIRVMAWVTSVAQNLTNKVGFLRTPIGKETVGSGGGVYAKYTVGSVLSMALVGAAIGALIYKIYKVLRNRIASTESVNMYYAKQRKRIKKALTESNSMFDELTMLTEAPNDLWNLAKSFKYVMQNNGKVLRIAYNAAGDQIFADSIPMSAVPKGVTVHQYAVQGRAAANAAAKAGEAASKTVKEAAKAEGFIASMRAKIVEMWNSAASWCGNNAGLLMTVGACLALVACWYGVKKSRDNGELEMAESVRPAKRTRRTVRRSAYSF